ncbi:MAG: site-specific integrase [Clostridia bacterium]|nr:site-specific integrase [Clostridia bacterium]
MPSYEKRNDLWSIRFRVFDGLHEHNKRLSGYKTKKDARAAYEEYLRKNIVQTTPTADPVNSFRDLVVEFLQRKKGDWASSSYLDAEMRINKHILPTFGNKKPAEISVKDIEDWQSKLTDAGYAYKYKHNLRAYMVQIYKYANRVYNVPNVMDKVSTFRNPSGKKEMQIYTPEEMKAFLKAAEADPIYHAFFRFLYFSGCRRGEALALSKDDLCPKDNKVKISRNLTFKCKGATFDIKTTKNESSIREVYIPQDVMRELLALPRNKFLFGTNDKPLSENTITRKFHSFAQKAGVKEIRLHDLRHSCASLLISNGVPITAVSEQLGHANTQQTLTTYAHMMPKDKDKILQALSSF